MSKFVKVKTELRDLSLIKQALEDLKLAYQENARYVHTWSGFAGKVPLLVQTKQLAFGLRETDDNAYEVIGDDMQMVQIRKTVAQVQQRYAYHKILAETTKAGFELVDENVGRDQVIRLTVRRWA
ncbi:MAG: DUF1257 domain-containing protein [Chloroflexi bacterium]|nr:DUF1257 domain-containing protein [Chloroflexota bacterium]